MNLSLEFSPPAERDDTVNVWGRWRVTDSDGQLVGFVSEQHEWLGHTYGPATYDAIHNPTGAHFQARWRSESYATPRLALDALDEHLRTSTDI
jgi:hypothetical protein